jgi:hypothetical protein
MGMGIHTFVCAPSTPRGEVEGVPAETPQYRTARHDLHIQSGVEAACLKPTPPRLDPPHLRPRPPCSSQPPPLPSLKPPPPLSRKRFSHGVRRCLRWPRVHTAARMRSPPSTFSVLGLLYWLTRRVCTRSSASGSLLSSSSLSSSVRSTRTTALLPPSLSAAAAASSTCKGVQ